MKDSFRYRKTYAETQEQAAKARAAKAAASRKGRKCSDCGLYGCVCQPSLLEWEQENRIKENRKKIRDMLLRC